ncbi:MAG: 30S ribosomal protein S20 [Alphaproteobacteria bacterium]|nr:30S ribosomal protein S20 [Alphaproteobacteria bacterium]
MANHKSAEKRIRANAARAAVNGARRSRIRTFIKKAELAIKGGNKEEAVAAFIKAESEMAKGVNKGVMHKNTVARKVSRLCARLKAIKA